MPCHKICIHNHHSDFFQRIFHGDHHAPPNTDVQLLPHRCGSDPVLLSAAGTVRTHVIRSKLSDSRSHDHNPDHMLHVEDARLKSCRPCHLRCALYNVWFLLCDAMHLDLRTSVRKPAAVRGTCRNHVWITENSISVKTLTINKKTTAATGYMPATAVFFISGCISGISGPQSSYHNVSYAPLARSSRYPQLK